MPLKIANPPVGGRAAVTQALAMLRPRTPIGNRSMTPQWSMSGSGPSNPKIVSPQKVYQISLTSLIDENPLDFAEAVAWRYLVIDGENAIEAAETTLGGANGISFSQVNRGPQVAGFVRAVELAEELAADNPDKEWELRYLRISAVYVDALWLYGFQKCNDLLIPIQSALDHLNTDQAYSPQTFFNSIRERALERLKSSDETNA